MHDLNEIQSFMADAVRELASLQDESNAAIAAKAPSIAAGNERLSPIAQLDIYREQFWLRHVGVMEEDFVSIVTLLGHDAFHDLARAYLTACPPRSFTLRDVGDRLAEFVARAPAYREDTLIADLARLEWCFVDAFDAPDAAPFVPSSIATAREEDWPRAVVVLHPSVQRVALAHPAHEYRAEARLRKSVESEHEASDEPIARPEPREVHLVVYRGEEKLHYIEIDPAAHALLDALAEGTPLERACEIAAQTMSDPSALEPLVGGWFQQWTSLGWVSEVRF